MDHKYIHMLLQVTVNIYHSFCSFMHLIILITRLPHTVFLSVLLFASHAKKPDHKSDPASNENEEEDENALKSFMISFNNFMSPLTKPIDKLLPYPLSLMLYLNIRPILDWMASHGAPWCCDFEQVPYKTIKKFDVS